MHSHTLRARVLVAAAALAPLMVMATPVPAAAQPEIITPGVLRLPAQNANCPTGFLCLYRDVGYSGGGVAVNSGRALNDFRALDFNDEMSSWINETAARYCWYPDINYSGTRFAMRAATTSEAVNLENNDTASSAEPC
ncbi:peptidase inhibitor family I36 protein [Streptomyces cyaneofuscatus]|uniref:peptidase inhibitor family I36 protein n=1 Tax=Streptomyces cyaneofuscatus TaxID=66883 RepID=UPI0038087066